MPSHFIEGELSPSRKTGGLSESAASGIPFTNTFQLMTRSLTLHLPAKYGHKILQGITEHFNGLLLNLLFIF